MTPVGRSPEGRQRFALARVARLATTRVDDAPHLVPIVFALLAADGPQDGEKDVVWSVVDAKPKSTTALRRLANIAAHPEVSLLVDHYTDDWSTLWWVRVDGRAEVVSLDDERAPEALAALRTKYPQYAVQPPPGPLLRVVVERWVSWSAG